jgi:hypothetical protein
MERKATSGYYLLNRMTVRSAQIPSGKCRIQSHDQPRSLWNWSPAVLQSAYILSSEQTWQQRGRLCKIVFFQCTDRVGLSL